MGVFPTLVKDHHNIFLWDALIIRFILGVREGKHTYEHYHTCFCICGYKTCLENINNVQTQ